MNNMAQQSLIFHLQPRSSEARKHPFPLFAYSGKGNDLRKHLISKHDRVVKKEAPTASSGKSSRCTSLMLDNLIKLTGAAREEAYQKICGRRSFSVDADARRCASVVKGHAAAECSSEKETADTLAKTTGRPMNCQKLYAAGWRLPLGWLVAV